jgi:ParB-like chromosome segregation protein Spo0J|tara:strand:+ start:94 stop:696 length:603 start_codon:yes stop_codon:yes gene_type:complete
MKIHLTDIKDIKPYDKNPRKISDKAIDMVANSIKEFGFQQPIVVDMQDEIVVGHTRYQASKKLNLKKVPVVRGDFTDEQAKAYRIADNRINEETGWDYNFLQEELNKLLDLDVDLNLTGFTSEELDSMFAKEDIQITDPIDVGDDENHLLNDVKMIQLFYEPDTEQKFREIIDKVKEKYSIDNISDAVLKCVENEQERIK